MIVKNFGDACSQLSTDTTIEIDNDESSETVFYEQQHPNIVNSRVQSAGLQCPSFAFTTPQFHHLMHVGLHE